MRYVGDGATTVAVCIWEPWMVSLLPLISFKCYFPRLVPTVIQAYEQLFNLKHDNIVQVHGICPKGGKIVMEYCHRVYLTRQLYSHNLW